MGTKIPGPVVVPPVAAGDQCTLCWGTGKEFGDIDTPSEIVITFSGISKGPLWSSGDPDPIDGDYLYQQNPVSSCVFNSAEGGFLATFSYLPGQTRLNVNYPGFGLVFISTELVDCDLALDNQLTQYFVGGSAAVTLPDTL